MLSRCVPQPVHLLQLVLAARSQSHWWGLRSKPIMVMNALFVDDSCPLCHDLLGPLTLAYFGRRQLFCLGPMATESPLDELCLNKMESMKRTPIHVYVHLADLGRPELQLAMCQTFPTHFNLDWRPRLPGPFLRRRCVQKQGAIRHQVGQTQPSGVGGAWTPGYLHVGWTHGILSVLSKFIMIVDIVDSSLDLVWNCLVQKESLSII